MMGLLIVFPSISVLSYTETQKLRGDIETQKHKAAVYRSTRHLEDCVSVGLQSSQPVEPLLASRTPPSFQLPTNSPKILPLFGNDHYFSLLARSILHLTYCKFHRKCKNSENN
ncbi:hypothetical protein CR513_60063, partial [Mucuna pruriens]